MSRGVGIPVGAATLLAAAALALPASAAASTTADFDDDGFEDVAIGAPRETLNGEMSTGIVHVAYGSAGGLTDPEIWSQASPDVEGVLEPFDSFGAALVAGDFDEDGFDDLAIGAPGEAVGDEGSAGAVNVLYGSGGGLQASDDDIFTQGQVGVGEIAEPSDQFGDVLAAGDLDGDGDDDLAIGCKFEDTPAGNAVGVVHVLEGGAGGLAGVDTLLQQGQGGMPETQEDADFFGIGLAIGDFQGSSHGDLAIGVQGEDVDGNDAGAVHVLEGSAAGPVVAGSDVITVDSPGVPGEPQGEAFGRGLSAGELGAGSRDDLMVAAAFHDFGDKDAGRVTVLYGAADRVGANKAQTLSQEPKAVPGIPNNGEVFGIGSTTANVGGSSHADLIVTAQGDTVNRVQDAGSIHVFLGGAGGVSVAGNQYFHQNVKGIPDRVQEDDSFGLAVGAGDFLGSGREDVVIGVDEDLKGLSSPGAVHLLPGSANGLKTSGDLFLRQGKSPFDGDPLEPGDFFGSALVP